MCHRKSNLRVFSEANTGSGLARTVQEAKADVLWHTRILHCLVPHTVVLNHRIRGWVIGVVGCT